MDYFKIADFACKGNHCCGKSHPMCANLLHTIDFFRHQFGKPIYVNSGFRCKTHNSRTKNASPTSLHMYGLAADLSLRTTEEENLEFYKALVDSELFDKVILYPTFVHLDMRGQLDGI